jgi:hypothetical protein
MNINSWEYQNIIQRIGVMLPGGERPPWVFFEVFLVIFLVGRQSAWSVPLETAFRVGCEK